MDFNLVTINGVRRNRLWNRFDLHLSIHVRN